jgi:hypothetical protein
MMTFLKKIHNLLENTKVMLLRSKLELVLLKKRNDYFAEVFPPEDLEAIAILMFWSRISLKVYAPASKKFLKRIEYFNIALNEFKVEFRLYHYPSLRLFYFIRISYVDGKASFTVYETNNIIFGSRFCNE